MIDPIEQSLTNHIRQLDEYDRQDRREEWAKDQICAAMNGDYVEQAAMLDRLGVPMGEYLSEYEEPENLAEAYYRTILAELDEEAREWNLNMALNRQQ